MFYTIIIQNYWKSASFLYIYICYLFVWILCTSHEIISRHLRIQNRNFVWSKHVTQRIIEPEISQCRLRLHTIAVSYRSMFVASWWNMTFAQNTRYFLTINIILNHWLYRYNYDYFNKSNKLFSCSILAFLNLIKT